MKSKYVTADSREAAEAKAAAYFSRDALEIKFSVINGGEGAASWLLLAEVGRPEELANKDAGFGLYYEADGVYLEVYDSNGGGSRLDHDALALFLKRKNVSGLNQMLVQKLETDKHGREKVASEQKEVILGEDLLFNIKEDESEASITLLAPEKGGTELSFEAAQQKIKDAGITHGLNEEALRDVLSSKAYGISRIIAETVPPVDGEDGKLVYHFSTDERTGKPREIGGGRVDYRSLDLYEPVEEGQLLVSRTIATEGTPGATVKGKEIKQKPGKDSMMPKGKGVNVNAERTEMHAVSAGMVQYINSTVNVSNIYKISGDCDLSVGNIDFDGCVHISGSVRSGHTVKASGAVIVGGTVEAATIIAGGNVEIKNGVQGADKGRIEAGGTISALYIERATAIADGNITVDVSIHSHIETGSNLVAKGKRGAIIGGRVGAAGNITASYIGAISNTQTEVVVGVMLRKRERIQHLEKEMDRLKTEMVKLDQLDAYLAKSKEKIDQETWNKLYYSGAENRRANKESLDEYGMEVDELKYELENATAGRVHVFETAFNGVRIVIGSSTYKVVDEISFATFRYKDGEIVYGPCELSKG